MVPHSKKNNLLGRSSHKLDGAGTFEKSFLNRIKILMPDFVIQGQLYPALGALCANESTFVS